MSRGKILYTPLPSSAVTLGGTEYLSLDEADFNFGTEDFALDALLHVDADAADAELWILAKGASSLASAAGWHWFIDKANLRLGLRINDGDVAATVVYSSSNVITLGSWAWVRVEADRDGSATFYVNGAAAGSGSIAAAAGSVSNADVVKAGAYDASTHRLKGAIDFLRVDQGRLLGAAWTLEEWYRTKYGCTRRGEDFLARWEFDGSLVDVSDNLYTLVWHGAGAAAYEDGWPYGAAPVEYAFQRNYRPEPELGWVETDDVQMALDGTSFLHRGPRLRRGVLEFPAAGLEQAIALQAVWEAGGEFVLHLDGGRPGFPAVMPFPPQFRPATTALWEISLEYRETT